MEEQKTEAVFEIRSIWTNPDSGLAYTQKRGPYRTLGHAKQGMRYARRHMNDPKIVKVTRTFTEVEEVVDL